MQLKGAAGPMAPAAPTLTILDLEFSSTLRDFRKSSAAGDGGLPPRDADVGRRAGVHLLSRRLPDRFARVSPREAAA